MALDRGFTLIEVLIALAILAVALAAALRATSIATDTAADFRERMLAGWVAENRLAEYTVGFTPELGERRGTARQGGVTFAWRERIVGTEIPQLRRIDVEVFLIDASEHAVAQLVGYATDSR